MTIVDITDANAEEYQDLIPDEYLTDVWREYYRGLIGVSTDDGSEALHAAIFWEVRNAERENVKNAAEIRMFTAMSTVEGVEIMGAFDERCNLDEVAIAFFEIEELKVHELEALKIKGFDIIQTEGLDVFVSVKNLLRLDIAKKAPPDFVKKISDLSSFQLKAGIMNSAFHDRYGLLDDLPFLPMSWYDQNLSSCVITDDKVSGILLVHAMKPGLYRVELLFSEMLDAPTNVLNMIRFSIRMGGEILPPEDKVLIRRHNRTVVALVKKLFPGEKGNTVWRGKRKM